MMSTARWRAVFCFACALVVACDNVGSTAESQDGAQMSLFGKKKQPAPTTVNPLVGAELKPIAAIPAAPARDEPSLDVTCTKYLVSGTPPALTFEPLDNPTTEPNVGFVIRAQSGSSVLLLNRPDNVPNASIEVWELAAAAAPQPTRRVQVALHPRESTWAARFIDDVRCLPNGRALVSVNYWMPHRRDALLLFDVAQRRFAPVADVSAYRSKYFESALLAQGSAMVLYYTDSVRKSAEIYHNYYNHFQLYTAAHPDGIEVLKLGIDTGNATRWLVADRTLYLETIDPRDPEHPRRATWSLDLSQVLQ